VLTSRLLTETFRRVRIPSGCR